MTTVSTKAHATLLSGCDALWSYLVFSYTSFTDRTNFADVLNLHPPAPTFMRLQKLLPMGYLAQACQALDWRTCTNRASNTGDHT